MGERKGRLSFWLAFVFSRNLQANPIFLRNAPTLIRETRERQKRMHEKKEFVRLQYLHHHHRCRHLTSHRLKIWKWLHAEWSFWFLFLFLLLRERERTKDKMRAMHWDLMHNQLSISQLFLLLFFSFEKHTVAKYYVLQIPICT